MHVYTAKLVLLLSVYIFALNFQNQLTFSFEGNLFNSFPNLSLYITLFGVVAQSEIFKRAHLNWNKCKVKGEEKKIKSHQNCTKIL